MILVSQEKIQTYLASGDWGERTLGDLFLAAVRQHPQALAVADPPNMMQITGDTPQRWTWAQLLVHVGKLVALLHAQGLRKDDIVMVQMPNGVALQALYLACACSGIVVSPIAVQYRAHEIDHVRKTTGARTAIITSQIGSYQAAQAWGEYANAINTTGTHASLRVLAYGSTIPPGIFALDAALAQTSALDAQALQAHMRHIALSAHDVVTVCWTSGTESVPKGVPRNHNEWLLVGQAVIEAGDLQPGASMVIPFPFVNMAGISTCLITWLLLGAQLHHHHPFDLDVFLAQLRSQPTDYTVVAPAILAMLLKMPEKLDHVDLGRLRRIGSGGGPLADWLVTEFAEKFGIEIVNYFGSNEGAGMASTPQDIADHRQRARYFPRIGVAGFTWKQARNVRTRLVDLDTEQDIHVPDKIGELRFDGPAIFSGYFNAPDLTRRAFDDQGYYRTGDLFEITGDRHQFYRFVGRHKDIVVRAGMNISCEEVENLLLAHPRVREAALIGYPDAIMGERLCAVIAAQDPPPSLQDLCDFLRAEGVAIFKWPERIIVVDALPRNPVGKVLKRTLRHRYANPDKTESLTP